MPYTYLKDPQVQDISDLVEKSASRAEVVLSELGGLLRKAAAMKVMESSLVPSRIPNHPTVSYDRPVIGDFIAVVCDIRNSTKHLRQAISGTYSLVERVFFETSIALPAIAKVMACFEGATTEYLGDGTLSLFAVDEQNPLPSSKLAYRSALSVLEIFSQIVNPVIRRYNLPALQIGIGIGRSRAIVSAVGLDGELQPNAFGECVFFASKLSKWGVNEIFGDSFFRSAFKKVEGGVLRFRSHRRDEIDGFLISRSD